jgi:hypothetical protein
MPLFAAALATVVLTSSSAYANHEGAGTGVESGAGTISPGLTTTPTVQTAYTFNGTVVATFAINSPDDIHLSAGSLNCSLSGASTIAETVLQSQGVGRWACSSVTAFHVTLPNGSVQTATVTVACDAMGYVRVGSTMFTIRTAGAITVSSAAGSTTMNALWSGFFQWEPDQLVGTVTSYKQQGYVLIETV